MKNIYENGQRKVSMKMILERIVGSVIELSTKMLFALDKY